MEIDFFYLLVNDIINQSEKFWETCIGCSYKFDFEKNTFGASVEDGMAGYNISLTKMGILITVWEGC